MAKIKYLGFLGLLGFLGFQNPAYFLFFLFFLFFLATPKPKDEGGFASPKPAGEVGSAAGKSFDLIKEQAKEKEQNMEKIRQFISGKDKFSNNDIENLLGISDATAERYLQDLEKEGKIRQVGTDGKYVYYQKA